MCIICNKYENLLIWFWDLHWFSIQWKFSFFIFTLHNKLNVYVAIVYYNTYFVSKCDNKNSHSPLILQMAAWYPSHSVYFGFLQAFCIYIYINMYMLYFEIKISSWDCSGCQLSIFKIKLLNLEKLQCGHFYIRNLFHIKKLFLELCHTFTICKACVWYIITDK